MLLKAIQYSNEILLFLFSSLSSKSSSSNKSLNILKASFKFVFLDCSCSIAPLFMLVNNNLQNFKNLIFVSLQQYFMFNSLKYVN